MDDNQDALPPHLKIPIRLHLAARFSRWERGILLCRLHAMYELLTVAKMEELRKFHVQDVHNIYMGSRILYLGIA